MLVPVTQFTGTRNSSSTLRTPTWARPRAPPPDSATPPRDSGRPTRGGGLPLAVWPMAATVKSVRPAASAAEATRVLFIALPGGDPTLVHRASRGHGTKVQGL